MDYVAFSPEFLYHMSNMIRSSIGAISGVGIYTFVLLLGLLSFLNFIQKITSQ